MTSSTIPSLYASLADFRSIINVLSVVEAFLIMILKSVSLSVRSLIFNVLPLMFLSSCCMTIAASQALANVNVSDPKTDLTTVLDLTLQKSIEEPPLFLSSRNIMNPTYEQQSLF